MKHLATVMMQLIKREIVGAADADEAALRDAALQGELYALSKRHDVAHLVGDALGRFCISLDSGLDAKFQKQQMLAVWRAQQIEYMKESAYRALTQAAVPFLPLKGAVMRQYYPEAWMRTSSDIDILIRESDLDRCVELLELIALEYGCSAGETASIMADFNSFDSSASNIFHQQLNGHYRCVELLKLIANEINCNSERVSAIMSKFTSFDSSASNINQQHVNGVYRCVELLNEIVTKLD